MLNNPASPCALSTVYGKTNLPLYAFSSHSFTAGGAIGPAGPTYAMLSAAYASTSWIGNAAWFAVAQQGVQVWTVPATGNYNFIVAGAMGGWSADLDCCPRVSSWMRCVQTII